MYYTSPLTFMELCRHRCDRGPPHLFSFIFNLILSYLSIRETFPWVRGRGSTKVYGWTQRKLSLNSENTADFDTECTKRVRN